MTPALQATQIPKLPLAAFLRTAPESSVEPIANHVEYTVVSL